MPDHAPVANREVSLLTPLTCRVRCSGIALSLKIFRDSHRVADSKRKFLLSVYG
jgi:hypothetical protein